MNKTYNERDSLTKLIYIRNRFIYKYIRLLLNMIIVETYKYIKFIADYQHHSPLKSQPKTLVTYSLSRVIYQQSSRKSDQVPSSIAGALYFRGRLLCQWMSMPRTSILTKIISPCCAQLLDAKFTILFAAKTLTSKKQAFTDRGMYVSLSRLG